MHSRRLVSFFVLPALTLTLLAGCGETGDPSPTIDAPPADPIPRRLLYGAADVQLVRMSPDGRWVAFVQPDDGVMNIWVAPVDDPAAAQPVTDDRDNGVFRYGWAHDGRHLLYVQDDRGDEIFRVHTLDLETNQHRVVTPVGARAGLLAGSPRRPNEVLLGVFDRDPRRMDVHRLDLTTGALDLVLENPGFQRIHADLDLEIRLVERLTPEGGVEVFAPDAGSWSEAFTIPPEDQETTKILGFGDGDTVYLADSRGRDTAALVALDLASGGTETLFEDPRADVEAVLFHPTTGIPEVVRVNYERREWTALDPALVPVVERLDALGPGELEVRGRSADGSRWLVADVPSEAPARFYVHDAALDGVDTGEPRYLFSDRSALDGIALAAMRPIQITSRDGLTMVGYVTLPLGSDPDGDGRPDAPVPTVLLAHGGPWQRDVYSGNQQHRLFSDRGWAVLSVNFRGSSGFGKNFLEAGNREWGAKMQDDLVDAARWAIDAGITDPERLAIMGASFGGYATLMGVARDGDLFTCGVDISGPSNLLTLAGSFPPRWSARLDRFARRMGDWRTEEGQALLRERSPLTHVDDIVDPLLVIHGQNDTRVVLAESEQLAAALVERNVPVTLVVYPDEGHIFRKPDNLVAVFAIAERFLHAQCFGGAGRAEAFGDALDGTQLIVPVGVEHVPGLAEALAARDAANDDSAEDADAEVLPEAA